MQDNNKMTQAKPFVKWAGGKTQLIAQLENLLPTHFHNLAEVTYIEPFIGGGVFYTICSRIIQTLRKPSSTTSIPN